jgi:hypothetical protein
MGIDWSSAWAAGQKTSTSAAPVVAAPTTTSSVAQPATTTPAAAPSATHTSASAAVEGVFDEVASLFDGVVGVSNARTEFGGRSTPIGTFGSDDYIGNVGIPYGSCIILTDSPSSYQYTNTFTNTQSESITVNVWLKAGPDMQPFSGPSLAPTSTTLTFSLAPGESKTVAFDENTQVGWAQSTAARTSSGSFDASWGEGQFVSSGCGYDVSAIENSAGSNYDMTISSVEAPNCKSTRTTNMWLTATDAVGTSDGSCYIAQGKATLTTIMGGIV